MGVHAGSYNQGSLGGYKNKLINGGLNWWQRGTGAFSSNTATDIRGGTYWGSADRWGLTGNNGQLDTLSMGQNMTAPFGFRCSMDVAAGFSIGQVIENNNLFYEGTKWVVSVYATGTPGFYVQAQDQSWGNPVSNVIATSDTSNGFTRYYGYFEMDQSINQKFSCMFSNKTASTIQMTGFQLEQVGGEGPPTPFERRSAHTEFALCAPYCYYQSGSAAMTVNDWSSSGTTCVRYITLPYRLNNYQTATHDYQIVGAFNINFSNSTIFDGSINFVGAATGGGTGSHGFGINNLKVYNEEPASK